MAKVILTFKVMPENPEVDLAAVQKAAEEKIRAFGAIGEMQFAEEPVAFGLKALKVMFMLDEEKGATDDLEADLASLEGVNSVDVAEVSRALG